MTPLKSRMYPDALRFAGTPANAGAVIVLPAVIVLTAEIELPAEMELPAEIAPPALTDPSAWRLPSVEMLFTACRAPLLASVMIGEPGMVNPGASYQRKPPMPVPR